MQPSTVIITKNEAAALQPADTNRAPDLSEDPATTTPDPQPSPVLSSSLWSDYDDDDEDWVPEILLPKAAEVQGPNNEDDEGGEGGDENEDEDEEDDEDDEEEGGDGEEEERGVEEEGREVEEGVIPESVWLSPYERLTMEFNSIAQAPARRGVRCGATTQRALRIPAVVVPHGTPPPEDQPAPKETDATPCVGTGPEEEMVEEGAPKEVTPVDTEAADVCVTLQDVAGPSDRVTDSPAPTQALPPGVAPSPPPPPSPSPPPSPQPEGVVQMTPLEFLISRGLYKDRLRVGQPPPPATKAAVGPAKSRLQGLRPPWASKMRSPVRSLRTAYRKVGDKIAQKAVAFLGAW
ncbi:hypothetical protein TWF481_001357 [Arthrobotrys musiformis]|uniref:Uncharacterized protein n=1 Tax=Arthrobotrys musiformis TaxID=47236 RepID=A0AAV9WQK8_9PEZI